MWESTRLIDLFTTADVEADMLANVPTDGTGRAITFSSEQVKHRAEGERHVRVSYNLGACPGSKLYCF
jgi:hypothetical protein